MWSSLQEGANLVMFTGEILNRKLHVLCSETTLVENILWYGPDLR